MHTVLFAKREVQIALISCRSKVEVTSHGETRNQVVVHSKPRWGICLLHSTQLHIKSQEANRVLSELRHSTYCCQCVHCLMADASDRPA